jgi:glycerol-3-phosphate dehydrogenase (NAD(P)+)
MKNVIVPNLKKKVIVINLSKGYDYINQMTLVQAIEKELPEEFNGGVMKLSGASFAIDVIQNKLTYFDLAFKDLKLAEEIATLLTTDSIKIHATDKLLETELNSMLKNPLAILMGIIDGLGYKENTRAAMFTACVREMQNIVEALGGNPKHVMSASGIGDFFLTGTSKKSRNYSTGYKLGKLNKVNKKILNTFATTEGLKVLENIMVILNKNNIDAPLMNLLYSITAERKEPKKSIEKFFKNLH